MQSPYALYIVRKNGDRLFHSFGDETSMHYFVKNNPNVTRLVIDQRDGSRMIYKGRIN
jgi:hypothetical protein